MVDCTELTSLEKGLDIGSFREKMVPLLRKHCQGNNQPQVTFVVVNWNQLQLTIDCLHSLFTQDYGNFEVILVDNGSNDGSVETVCQSFPKVVIFVNERNLGIASANNIGIRDALEKGADYIFLLNNDTVIDPDMLSALVGVAESDSKIGMTGPTMLYYDIPDIVWSAGSEIDWRSGFTSLIHNGESLNALEEAGCQEVDYIPSCAVCIKRAVLEDIGLVDERTFIYYDEADLFARAARAGWRSVYVPWAKMRHKVSATMGESSPRTDYYIVRNNLLFLAKNLKGWRRVSALGWAGGRHLLAVIAYTVKDHNGARRFNRNAKLLGLRDAILGRWGEMGDDVATACGYK